MDEFEPLRIAIVKRAVIDYKAALKRNNTYRIAMLEIFFLSDYGQLLSYNQGQYIIDQCRKGAEVAKYE